MKTPPSPGVVGHLDIRPGRIRSVSERRALFSIVKPPRAGRVLLVEDDRDVRRIISLALRRAAIEVVEAETAEQARRIFENAGADGAEFDAIVADIALPGDMNGLLLGEWLRICFGDVPVIYITGLIGWDLPALPRPNRATMVVCKPFGARTIVDAVTGMLRGTGACYDHQPNHYAL